jgi:hypothetical protein
MGARRPERDGDGMLARPRRGSAVPRLLLGMLAATLAIVAAVAVMGGTGSGWADAGAFALLLVTLALVVGAILRLLRDEGP